MAKPDLVKAGGPRRAASKSRGLLKVYVAAAYAHAETADAFGGKVVKALRERGIEAAIVSRWHGEALENGWVEDSTNLELQRQALDRNYEDLRAADKLIVLGVLGHPRATFSEVGAFLAFDHPFYDEGEAVAKDAPKIVAWVWSHGLVSSTNIFMSHRGVAPVHVDGAPAFGGGFATKIIEDVARVFADPLTKSVFSARET